MSASDGPSGTQRVVAAFDDPHEADRVREELARQAGTGAVVENDVADEDLAFAVTGDRGDSAERQPDVTVAVDVRPEAAREVEAELAAAGADVVETESEADRDR